MPADGRIQYEGSSELQKYKLPVTDVQKSKRNFEGVNKEQWYSLAELQMGDLGGNTETDSQTETPADHKGKGERGGGGYTTINKKSTKGGRSWKSSSKKGTN